MNAKSPSTLRCTFLGVVFAVLVVGSNSIFAFETWLKAQPGLSGKDLNAVYFVDAKRGWIGGDLGFLSHTEDGGRTWARQILGTTESVNDIYFRNRGDGYLLAGSRVFQTRDSGQIWSEIHHFLPSEFDEAEPELYSVRFTGKKLGWVVGSASRHGRVVDSILFSTNDGGSSWERQKVPTKGELIHLTFTNGERGWIVGASGTILRTDDGGGTWKMQRSGTQATLYHVDFKNSRLGWVVGERGTVLRTIDGGESWSHEPSPVRSTLLSVQFTDEEEGWAIGRGGTLLRSNDSGRTWTREESGTNQNLYALFFIKKLGWVVGGDGLVLHQQ